VTRKFSALRLLVQTLVPLVRCTSLTSFACPVANTGDQ
jgi:hypothetical protein